MYGIIYVAVKDYAEALIGHEKWESVLQQSGVIADFTVTEQPYNDDNTYILAQAIAQEKKKNIDTVLHSIGRQVIITTSQKFKTVMSSRGETLHDYLLNLPNFHNRISLIYPELTPPEFSLSSVSDNSITVHYRKRRQGMAQYIKGYLAGLGEVFHQKTTIDLVDDGENGPEVIYKITW